MTDSYSGFSAALEGLASAAAALELRTLPFNSPYRQQAGDDTGFADAGAMEDAVAVAAWRASRVVHWNERVTNVFASWFDLPDPAAFAGNVDQLQRAAWACSVTTQNGDQGIFTTGNPEVEAITNGLVGQALQLRGAAAQEFYLKYAGGLPSVLEGLAIMIDVVGCAVTGESQIWARTRAEVMDIVQRTTDAMNNPDSDSVNWSKVLTVVGAVAASVALFIPTDGASGLLAAGVLSEVATVSGAAASFVPQGGSANSAEISGSDPDEVLDSLAAALINLNKDVTSEEQVIRDLVNKYIGQVGSQPTGFDLPDPSYLTNASGPGAVLDQGDIKYREDVVRQITHRWIPMAVAHVENASKRLDVDQSVWWRHDLGLGTYGPVLDVVALAQLTENLLRDVSGELDRAGSTLELAYQLLKNQDADTGLVFRSYEAVMKAADPAQTNEQKYGNGIFLDGDRPDLPTGPGYS